MADARRAGDRGSFAVVPPVPGPLLRPRPAGGGRSPDDLDAVIDELLPDVTEGPGLFDVVLAVGGAVALIWGVASGTPAAVVVGAIAVVLGAVLPARSAWRRARAARAGRHHDALRSLGAPLDTTSAEGAALADRHDALLVAVVVADLDPELAGTVLAAAHAAVSEAAALLQGRPAATDREKAYVTERTQALADLTARLAEPVGPGDIAGDEVDADVRMAAVEEVDALGGPNALDRLAAVDDELQVRRGRGA